jgi:hypothetical protein
MGGGSVSWRLISPGDEARAVPLDRQMVGAIQRLPTYRADVSRRCQQRPSPASLTSKHGPDRWDVTEIIGRSDSALAARVPERSIVESSVIT